MDQWKLSQLPNGIRIATENIPHVKSFSLGFWFNVGSRSENRKNNGISHFLEHMFFKGTKNRTAKKISDDVETLGGYLNAFTSKEHTCFYGRGLAQNINKTFEVVADMLQNPLLKENEISKEAGVVVDELHDIEDSPEELIFDEFESNIYERSPLALPIIGTEKNIRGFSRPQLFNFISENYGTNNLYIVASGSVKHQDIVNLTRKYFAHDLKVSRLKRNIKTDCSTSELYVHKPIQQSHLIIGRATHGFKDKKRNVLNVLSQILGEGSSSRLFQTVREKNGMTYQINSFLNSFYDVSSFGVYFSTNDNLVEKVLNLVYKEFKKLRTKKVYPKELQRAKEYLKGNILMSLENTTNRMIRSAHTLIYFDKIKPVEETIKEIDSVTEKDILEISNELFDEKKLNKILISSKNLFLKSAA